MEELTNLDDSPLLKELLIMYVTRQYEKKAELDDWHLLQEYNWLKKNNQLNELFIEEALTNSMKDEHCTG